MRDIREDLKERIRVEHARREPHQEALKQIDDNIAGLERLLATEESRSNGNGSVAAILPRPAGNLTDYLTKMLKKAPRTLDEMRDAAVAAGYFEGAKESPGRAIHGKLLNPIRAGRVIKDAEGKYHAI